MKFCPYCQYIALDKTDIFCQKCGHNLVQDILDTGISKKSDEDIKNESFINNIIFFFGIIAEILFIYIALSFYLSVLLIYLSLLIFFPFVFIYGNNFIHDLKLGLSLDKIVSISFNLSLIFIIIISIFFMLLA